MSVQWLVRFGWFLLLLTQPASAQPQSGMSLEDLVREVKVALLRVQDGAEASALPKLSSAVLEANTEVKIDAGGKVSLWIIEFGASRTDTIASTVILKLTPPKPGASSDVSTVRIADALASAILAGGRAIKAAMAGNPPLVAVELKARVRFAIASSAGGGLSVKFAPIGGSAQGSISDASVQSIEVVYAP